MDSRLFISEAASLIADIKTFSSIGLSYEAEQIQGEALQKRVNQAFSGLQNPSLPSAFNLREVATRTGFFVDMKSPLQQQISWFNTSRN